MQNIISELFAYDFIVRAVAVGIMVSVCASLLGVSLVLKRYSMIGDGLGHVAFGALCIAVAFNMAPLLVSVPVVIIAAVMLLRIRGNVRIKGDAAIAVISSSALAIGIIATSLTKGMNIDIYNYMFGSILAMSVQDVYLGIGLSAAVLLLFIFLYNIIFAITFDEDFARATGIKVDFFNTLIAVLTAVTIVVGMRIMGTLLISSLIVFPALTSMRLCSSFKSVVICSGIVSSICFFLGILFSYSFDIPVGASIVVLNLAAFVLFFIAGNVQRHIKSE
jgi:zinc transport system permease protein